MVCGSAQVELDCGSGSAGWCDRVGYICDGGIAYAYAVGLLVALSVCMSAVLKYVLGEDNGVGGVNFCRGEVVLRIGLVDKLEYRVTCCCYASCEDFFTIHDGVEAKWILALFE